MKNGIETRLYVNSSLNGVEIFSLKQKQVHYLKNVLRLGLGDEVALFNGYDGEWRAKIIKVARQSADLCIVEQTREQSDEPDVWLAFAPIKRNRINFTVQKATELGVMLLWPVITHRTIVNRINIKRMRSNVIEASEQSNRLTIPKVCELDNFNNLIDSWPIDRAMIVANETGGTPIAEMISMDVDFSMKKVGFLIGPEGGFAKLELELLSKLPFAKHVSLGKRLLCADTSALAVLAIWQALLFCSLNRHN
ncbi:RNA methyltransferase family protein [Candidatus Endolissoclinum faulkneri L2]|uniref:Ribosomal RNA small subunit methyltransferase E n=1 Tax=Candidatus Endolissoclinum faulkneri L2 TaxID=1193729 RepID=K7Z2X7_9PROT|nr:16S rRNA (uracil(1498)-N(3))-methyltransferase [Candidatus Endolissoclinum faulkneri]AFX98328.1 RNA methyltransferase family protein [Candidatus Endolissoclinum faulkneri L2]